jgi:hypothetical protein
MQPAGINSASQEIPHHLCIYGTKMFINIFAKTPLVSIQRQTNSIHNLQHSFHSINFNIIFLSMIRFSIWSVSVRVSNQNSIHIMRFQILTVESMKIRTFWDVVLCSLRSQKALIFYTQFSSLTLMLHASQNTDAKGWVQENSVNRCS